jgi:hypothetical protein
MNIYKFIWPHPIPKPRPLTPSPYLISPDSVKPEPVYIRSKEKCKKYIETKIDNFSKNNANLQKFSSLPIVESLFNLYLFKKYKSGCVLLVDKQYYITGVSMYTQFPNYNLEIYDTVSTQIVDCIKRGTKLIIIPLCLVFGNYSAHANILIYRQATNELEHFEPHGRKFMGEIAERKLIKYEIDVFVSIFNVHLKHAGFNEVEFIESSKVCPYAKGFQRLEGAVPNKKYAIGGYCGAWSMLFTELALANPSLSSREIIEIVYDRAGGLLGGQYLKNVIEGYSDHISDKINKYYSILFNKVMTTAEIQCRDDLATDDEKIVIMDEFRFIVDLEMELIMSNTSVKRKLVHLKRIRPKDDPLVTKKIVILEKMQVLEELLTPVSKSLQLPLPVKKICPEGKHLNPVTNRCNKDKKNVTQKICPEGQHLNPVTNRCNKDKAKPKNVTKKICPEGKHLNVKTNRCNKDKKVQTI